MAASGQLRHCRVMRILSFLLMLGSAAAAPVTFTKTYSNAVEVLQWTETQGRLTGTYQQVLGTSSQPPALKTTTAPFAGTRSGSTVTLTFTQGFLDYTDTRIWTGTLSGNSLKITWPLASGGLNAVSYMRSTPEAYNAAVAGLSQAVDAARTQFTQQQEMERAERSVIETQTRTVREADRTARGALDDAATLTRELQAGIEDVADAVKLLEKDLASHRKDQAKLLQAAGEAKTCYDVSAVQDYALSSLSDYSLSTLTDYDTINLESASEGVQDDLALAQETLGGLQAASEAYRSVPAANPRAEARLSFQPRQVTQAQTALGAAMKTASAALATAQAQHKGILREAHALVDEAEVVAGKLTCEGDS